MPALAPPPPPRQGCAAEDTLSLAKVQLISITLRQHELLKAIKSSIVIRVTDLDALLDLQVAAARAAQILCRAGDELRAQEAQDARKVVLALEAKQQILVRENAALRGALATVVRNRMRREVGPQREGEQQVKRIKREDST